MTTEGNAMKTMIASHRGGTLEHGDSTPSGFRATSGMPLEQVEFDVHPTADGHIVVHHDATLDRTTDRIGALADLTLHEIKAARINYSKGESPLTLEELCNIYRDGSVGFRCEIKADKNGIPYKSFIPHVVETLARKGMLEKTVFSSFHLEILQELKRTQERPVLWLISPQLHRQLGIPEIISIARTNAIPEIGVNIELLDERVVEMCSQSAIAIGCWAAHSASQMTKAFALGANVMTTDRPSVALRVRDEFYRDTRAS
jgi:glycerophosphoryl diester phosphodiesterase